MLIHRGAGCGSVSQVRQGLPSTPVESHWSSFFQKAYDGDLSHLRLGRKLLPLHSYGAKQ